MNTPKLTLITLILSAFVSSYAFAADKEKSSMKDMTPMADMLKGKSGEEFDAHYLGMLSLHHQDGIKMARMAVDKATSSELKQMMQKSIRDQQDDVEKMSRMLKKHNKSANDFSKPAETEQMMQKSMSELRGLSGAEFDRMFAKHMAHHHMDAIAMSKMAQSKAKDSEVKELASKTLSSQREEHQKLERMAKS